MGKTKATKCKRAPWMEQTLTQALAAIKDGMSQRDAADNFKIPRRTLRNHIKSGIAKKTLGRKSVLTVEEEQDLVQRIIRYCEVGMPITASMLGRYVYKFCVTNNTATPFNDKTCTAGRDWIKAFLKRHRSVAQRKAQSMNPARAQKLNRFVVNDYFTKMERVQSYSLLISLKEFSTWTKKVVSCRSITSKRFWQKRAANMSIWWHPNMARMSPL